MVLLNVVVDLSHHNTVTSFDAAKAEGVRGVIHKATEGTEFVDSTYDRHKNLAKTANLLWGSYHFARQGDVEAQVDHFISVAGTSPDELFVLDFEPNSTAGTMSLAEAESFVTLFQAKTGFFPGVYSGQSFINEMVGNKGTVLSSCWLWIARYGPNAPVVPRAWSTFTMWQYTDGNAGPQPHQVGGIGRCDRDKFNGDDAAFEAFWRSAPTVAAPAATVAAARTRKP